MRFSRAALVLCLFPLAFSGCADSKPAASGGGASTSGTSSGGSAVSGGIPIGEYASMTGSEATFGSSQDNGVKLAVAEINKAGGVNGDQLKLIGPEDDEGNPSSVLSVVKKLIAQDKVIAVIGEVASTNSITAAPVCNANKVPMISPSSTNPKLTQKGTYIFRVCFIDPFQGTVNAKFALDTLKVKKAAILTNSTSDYSVGLSQYFKEAFTKGGGQVVAESNYQKGDPDFKAQLTTIKNANPDVLFVPGYYTEVGTIAKQAKEIGLNVPLLGGDGWDSPKLIEGAGGAGGALEGSYFSNHSSMENPAPEIQKFVAAYKNANAGKMPDSISALSYDAIGVLADALKRAGKPTDGNYDSEEYRAKLRDAIAATKDFDGVTGKITLGPDRDAVKSAVILQVKGDGFKYVTTIKP